jgi:serine/threonine-protein kinase
VPLSPNREAPTTTVAPPGVVVRRFDQPRDDQLDALDEQFLNKANRRLGLVSGAFAGAITTIVVISLLLYGPLGWQAPAHLSHFLVAQLILILLTLGMAFVCRRRVLNPRATVRLGLVYQVTGALIISVCAFHGDMLLQPVMVKLSWLAVWILLFPLFVPGPPARSLAVSLLAATTAPAVFLNWSFANDQPLPTLPVFALTFAPYYVCAGLAVLPAWLVYDLGATASAAREAARRLGSYRLIERLGGGGMGEVWRAEHSLLARPAAIKLVHEPQPGQPGPSKAEVLARFEREAKTTAALTSPHTVSLYDYGLTVDGTLYYAMELLDGLDLHTLVVQFGPLSPARAVYLLRQVCDSLSEAHSAGLVHRDIKPSNLVACRVGGRVDFVKVLDFGLVRRVHQTPDDRLVSDARFLLGTPAFMAPELVTAPEDVDARADIYAMGCVAYWLLTGALVFDQPTVMATVADHVHAIPNAPSESTEGPIPAELDDLVLACLAKVPALRPQSADELHRLLGEVTIDQPWTQRRARAWWEALPQ